MKQYFGLDLDVFVLWLNRAHQVGHLKWTFVMSDKLTYILYKVRKANQLNERQSIHPSIYQTVNSTINRSIMYVKRSDWVSITYLLSEWQANKFTRKRTMVRLIDCLINHTIINRSIYQSFNRQLVDWFSLSIVCLFKINNSTSFLRKPNGPIYRSGEALMVFKYSLEGLETETYHGACWSGTKQWISVKFWNDDIWWVSTFYFNHFTPSNGGKKDGTLIVEEVYWCFMNMLSIVWTTTFDFSAFA